MYGSTPRPERSRVGLDENNWSYDRVGKIIETREEARGLDNQKDFFDEFISDETEIDDSEANDEFDDDTEVDLRTVLLIKSEMIALLGLRQSTETATIVRIDPRQPVPSSQRYDDTAAAVKWFNRSLATSKRNGWEVIFDGRPQYG